ncbi:type II toxin-antitoxin system death-on-curing family toxin [Streptomyces sp. NPDC058953]|uniref:type II toxin-antitoxin system death-on-curing family toxin n=1 Tax=unclassified Streptomyces TaxID=2593676 RepID=UPI003688A3C0
MGPGPRLLTEAEAGDLAEIGFGGPVGVRDAGLLASAVHRPGARMYGVEAYPDTFGKAAALLHALAVNHPLVDGNKRMAWLSTAVFLHLNGEDMRDVDQDAAYDLVVGVASGTVAEMPEIAVRLRELRAGAQGSGGDFV